MVKQVQSEAGVERGPAGGAAEVHWTHWLISTVVDYSLGGMTLMTAMGQQHDSLTPVS